MRFSVIPILFIVLHGLLAECRLFSDKNEESSSVIFKDMSDDTLVNRKAAVAGRFYEGSKPALIASLKDLFSEGVPSRNLGSINALICPHAGYIFSGETAASAFNQLGKKKRYENVFIIGSSHHALYDFASIYAEGNYITPLGEVKVNRALAKKIIETSQGIIKSYTNPHIEEHCIEVQLPFLQYLYGDELRIVPILIGTQSQSTCKQIANLLKPYFNEKNLFVISSDFSHYPDYEDARLIDSETAQAILKNSSSEFLNTIDVHSRNNYNELVTSACGWTSILTLLYLTENDSRLKYKLVEYKNSGDSKYGDKNRVVGYNSFVVISGSPDSQSTGSGTQETNFRLTNSDKKQLLEIARATITSYLQTRKLPAINDTDIAADLKQQAGAFVTLNKKGALRGCIGRFNSNSPLFELVREMSIASATQDTRFPAVSIDELPFLDIEISVLTPLHKIKSTNEIILGKHGIYIKKGMASGTFLPQVAKQTGWNLEEFLGHCARDKAGLDWEGWKEAEIFTYEAIVFDEKQTGFN